MQLLLSAVYLHTEDRHLGGNNDVTVQINSRDFSVGDTTAVYTLKRVHKVS